MKKLSNQMQKSALIATSLLAPFFASAANCTVDPKGGVNQCTTGSATASVASLVVAVTGWILGFAGALAVLMIIYGGIIYMTSAGNDKRVTLGKQILTYAIAGLVVILLSSVIVVFVGNALNAAQSAAH